jgi:DNA repair exonuclease SbcCD ATPase subunit
VLNLKKIRFKNLLSYGNAWSEFFFEPGITRLMGVNGHGKSSLIEALYFAFFGKPYRKISLGLLVNNVNKEGLEVQVEFSVNDTEYRIERGLRPNFHYIYSKAPGTENFMLRPLDAKTKSYQEFQEQEVLRADERIFNQVYCKTATRNMSFFQLGKGDKRANIESLFDIQIFSEMNRTCKGIIEGLESNISDLKKGIRTCDLLIEQETLNIEKLRNIKRQMELTAKKAVDEVEQEIATLRENLAKYAFGMEKLEAYKVRRGSLDLDILNIKSVITEERNRQARLDSSIKLAEFKLKLFKDTCVGCPKIADISGNIDLESLKKERDSATAEITRSTAELEAKREELAKCERILSNEKLISTNTERVKLRLLELEKNKYVKADDIQIDEAKLSEKNKERAELSERFNLLVSEVKHQSILKSFLSDEGFRTRIIKSYLPYLNKLLNTYLQKFQTDIIFHFDEEFNEVVVTKYKESFNYFSFSEGQKRRIDLSVLFAFLEFSQTKNRKATSNVIFLDEISSTLDAEGENMLYDILRGLANKGKCIVTVSASGNIDPEKVDRLFEAQIDRGFSKLSRIEN